MINPVPASSSQVKGPPIKMNRYLLKGTGVGALGGLLFGFDTAVIAGATHQLTQVYYADAEQLGITVAIALVGTVIGAMSAGAIGQKFGGRDTLRVMAVLVCDLGAGLRSCVELVCAARRPIHWRPGHRRLLGAWPGLHRRARPRPMARPAGRYVPGQHRRWHPARILLELRDRRVEHRRDAMALAARNRRSPRNSVPDHALRHSAQLALAGHPGPHRRGARRYWR